MNIEFLRETNWFVAQLLPKIIMPRVNLTDRTLKSVKPAPVGKRIDLMDAIVPGLGVRVNDKGGATFFLLSRFPGSTNPTRRTIGKYGRVTLAQAREQSRIWLEKISVGEDPKFVEGEATQNVDATFGEVARDYLRLAVVGPDRSKPIQRKGLVVERQLIGEFVQGKSNGKKLRPALDQRPIASITQNDILKVIDDAIARGAQYQAHNLLGHVRTMFNWAIARGNYGIDRSPCDRMRPKIIIGKKALLTRVLTNNEIRVFWDACGRLGYPYGLLFQMLLLSGQCLTGGRWRMLARV